MSLILSFECRSGDRPVWCKLQEQHGIYWSFQRWMKRHFHTALFLLDVSVEQNARFFLSGIVIDEPFFLIIKEILIKHIGKCGKIWTKNGSYFRGKPCEQFCVFISRFCKKAVTDLWGRSLKIGIRGVSQFSILSEFYIILYIHLFLATK